MRSMGVHFRALQSASIIGRVTCALVPFSMSLSQDSLILRRRGSSVLSDKRTWSTILGGDNLRFVRSRATISPKFCADDFAHSGFNSFDESVDCDPLIPFDPLSLRC